MSMRLAPMFSLRNFRIPHRQALESLADMFFKALAKRRDLRGIA